MSSGRPHSGGPRDGDHAQPEEQVLAEAARAHRLVEPHVGGGDETDVGAPELALAQPAVLLLLDEAQHLGLARRGQRVDLVEEEGAALGGRHQALAVVPGARERAPHVAEQLVLEQLGAEGPAVDRDEVRGAALAPPVEVPRIELLADSARARDEDLGIRAGDLVQGLEDPLMCEAPADDLRPLHRHSPTARDSAPLRRVARRGCVSILGRTVRSWQDGRFRLAAVRRPRPAARRIAGIHAGPAWRGACP